MRKCHLPLPAALLALGIITTCSVLPVRGQAYGYGPGYGSYHNHYGGSGGYRWGTGPGYGTIAGSYAAGLGEAIRAQGQYNLLTSEAAINLEEARRRYLENRVRATQTYFDLRRMNREYTQAEQPRPASASQAAALAKAAAPKPLSISQLDPVRGTIAWPGVLRDDDFAVERGLVEAAVQNMDYDRASIAAARDLYDAANALVEKLRSRIMEIPPTDFINAKKFVDSLVYTLTNVDA